MGIGSLARILPDVTGDGADCLGIGGAGGKQRAGPADGRVARVVAIARTVGRGVGEQLTLRAAIAVDRGLVSEGVLAHHAGLGWGWVAIAGDAQDRPFLQSLSDAGRRITGIEPD